MRSFVDTLMHMHIHAHAHERAHERHMHMHMNVSAHERAYCTYTAYYSFHWEQGDTGLYWTVNPKP